MAITFVVGRAGTGKTRLCLDAVLDGLARREPGALLLLVPEQASLQMERALALRAPQHGFIDAHVMSFSRLARKVLAERGDDALEVSPTARRMALHAIVQRLAPELPPLTGVADAPGLIVGLDSLVQELLRECVTPAALSAAASRTADAPFQSRWHAWARVYEEYCSWLGGVRFDPAAALARVREQLESCGWLAGAMIWVDGFAGFTGQELATLVALARLAREVTVTLLADPRGRGIQDPRSSPDPVGLFWKTEVTYQRLRRAFQDAGVAISAPGGLDHGPSTRLAAGTWLYRLEAGFIDGAPATSTSVAHFNGGAVAPAGRVRLLECADHRAELHAAAGFIRRSIAASAGGLRYRDFAIITRDLAPLAELVAEVFEQYEIPFFLDQRRSLREHALTRWMAALFDAVREELTVESMVRLLRSGLTNLTRREAEFLETVAVRFNLDGDAAWRRAHWPGESDAAMRAADSAAQRPLHLARQQLVDSLDLLRSAARRSPPPTGAEWAQTVLTVAQSLGIAERLAGWSATARAAGDAESAEIHRLAWDAFCEVLDDCSSVLGSQPLSLVEAAELLTAGLRERTVGLAPTTLDQVLVGSIERSRHPELQYAWIAAFNEGVFPARPGDDALLPSRQRDALIEAGLDGLQSRRNDILGERLLAYIAMTRPSRGLVISYARRAENGDELQPSPLLAAVQRILPDVCTEHVTPDPPPTCAYEAAAGLISARRCPVRSAARRRHLRLARMLRSRGDHTIRRFRGLLRGLTYRNSPRAVGNYRRPNDLPGIVWSGSTKEIEAYLRCPFRHFAMYGLRLQTELRPATLERELGDLMHRVVSRVTRRVIASGRPVNSISDDRWSLFVDAAFKLTLRGLAADAEQRTADRLFLLQGARRFVREVVFAHAERWRRGKFVPSGSEIAFDDGGALPALALTVDDVGSIRLHGVIDRVDRCIDNGDWWLVYDYKSTVGPLSREYLIGPSLQLYVYLLAVMNAGRDGAAAERAGILAAPVRPDLGVLDRNYVASAAPTEQRMYLYRPRGSFEKSAVELLDSDVGETQSPVIAVRRKKNSREFDQSQSRDIVPAGHIAERLQQARHTIGVAVRGIAAGRIDIAPLVENRTRACAYCDFQPVCRFDRLLNEARPAATVLPPIRRDAAKEVPAS